MRDRQKQLFLPVIFRQNHNVCSNLAQIRQSSLRLEPSHLRQLQPSGLGQHAGGTPLGKSLADLDAEGFRQNNELRAAAFTFSPKSHTVDAGGHLGVQILKTTCSVLFDEQAHGREDSGILGSADAAASGQPVMKTAFGTARSVKIRGQNIHLCGQTSGQSAEREALGHAPHLSVRSDRHKTTDRVGKSRLQLGQNRGHGVGFGQFVQERAARVAVMKSGQFFETVDHGSGMRETVQFGEHGRIHRQTHKTHLLPASGFQPVFSQLVGQAEFAAGEKEQTPGMGFAKIAFAAGAAFTLTVGQHVGAFGQNLAVDLSDFIQNQHIVVVQDSDILKAVVRGAPASDVFRTAPDGRGNLEGRCFAR